MDQYSPITPNELYLNYAYINKTEYKNKFKYNSWAPKTVDFNDFEFPLTVDYKSLSNKVAVKHVGLTKYTQYKDCKGFKNANNTTFVVKNLISDANYEVNNVTLYFNKLTYTFTDMLNKSNGEITRSFSSSEQEISNNFKSSTVKNVGTIDPLINNGLLNDTKILTLDCETYLVKKVQKLMSVAFFDGKSSKFYFIGNFKSEFELIKALLFDLLEYSGHNIYIHNGIRFDLVFLFKHFIKVAKDNNLHVDVIYKDGELLNVSVIDSRDKKNVKIIQFKDSLKLLLGSLSKLAKFFNVPTGKGTFPFDFAQSVNFNYEGPTPGYKYYAFNGKSLLNYNDYLNLVKPDWNFREELKAYNIQDCIVLYNILIKFDQLIRDKFNFNFKNNPTISSLAFSIYRFGYIPNNLIYEVKEKQGNKVKIFKKSFIDNLDQNIDSALRESYFGGHVDSYIPYFKALNNKQVEYSL